MAARIKQILILVIISVIAGLTVNGFSGNRIPYIGDWPSVIATDSVLVPPSAEPGDPPFISLDEAAGLFQDREAVFIDARDPEDYIYGHIRGAVNVPYDYLPYDDPEAYENYWSGLVDSIPFYKKVITYCSGAECESSLFLGRELVARGYGNVSIFYGGWREWETAGLPTITEEPS